MKTVLLLFVILVSCNSNQHKKEAIIDRQQELTVQINSERDTVKNIVFILRNNMAKSAEEITDLKERADMAEWNINKLQKAYDSLELELKKY